VKHAPTITPYLSVLELSQYLKLHPETIRAKVRAGTFPIPAIRTGGRTSAILFERAAVASHFRAIADAAAAELAVIRGLVVDGWTEDEAVAFVQRVKASGLSGTEFLAAVAK